MGREADFRYALRIPVIVLLSLQLRSDLVPLRHRKSTQMLSTTARLHSDDAGRNLVHKINECLPLHSSANSHCTFVVDVDNTAVIFAYIDTQN